MGDAHGALGESGEGLEPWEGGLRGGGGAGPGAGVRAAGVAGQGGGVRAAGGRARGGGQSSGEGAGQGGSGAAGGRARAGSELRGGPGRGGWPRAGEGRGPGRGQSRREGKRAPGQGGGGTRGGAGQRGRGGPGAGSELREGGSGGGERRPGRGVGGAGSGRAGSELLRARAEAAGTPGAGSEEAAAPAGEVPRRLRSPCAGCARAARPPLPVAMPSLHRHRGHRQPVVRGQHRRLHYLEPSWAPRAAARSTCWTSPFYNDFERRRGEGARPGRVGAAAGRGGRPGPIGVAGTQGWGRGSKRTNWASAVTITCAHSLWDSIDGTPAVGRMRRARDPET